MLVYSTRIKLKHRYFTKDVNFPQLNKKRCQHVKMALFKNEI